MTVVDYAVETDVAVLTVTHPPVNALSHAVRAGLAEALARAEADDGVRAIVVTGDGATFIAGADISEFGTPKASAAPTLRDLLEMLDACAKPTVAAINGAALGGGLEVTMCCHARVGARVAKVGLPEVKLGLIPGAGGTVRLPRLVGPDAALDMITTGRPVGAEQARALGVLDEVADDARAGAVSYARKLADAGAPAPVLQRDDKIADFDPQLFEGWRAKTKRKARGQLSPMKAVDAVEAACTLPAADALKRERELFEELLGSDQRKALIHAFFAEREARKIPDVPKSVEPVAIERAAIIGAGLMGGGIAMVFANAGIAVRLMDVSQEAVDKGRAGVAKSYAASVKRGSMGQDAADRAMGLIEGGVDYAALGDVDFVVEAVFEDLDLKRDIFARLDAAAPAHAILATNTSSLDIDAIAAATKRRGKVIGAHFFSPAHVMRLLEAVRGAQTSPETIASVMALSRRLGKVAVLAGNCDGFIGNRMLQFYGGQSEMMMEEGASPEQIDAVAERFGMAMGPVAMRDLAGIDTSVRIRAIRRKTLPKGERMSNLVEAMFEAGRLGQKNAKGFYRYEGRERVADPEALAIIEAAAKAAGVTRREIADDEIRDRLFHPLVNEGARELEDGTAIRAGDIDVAWIYGYGFPAHRGGPMFWGESDGLARTLETARRLGEELGPRWRPAALLERLVSEGKGFAEPRAILDERTPA